MRGALRELLDWLQRVLRQNRIDLTNRILEANHRLYPLVDGVDATLIELLHDELGDEQFREIASSLAAGTFASRQIDDEGRGLLTGVFALRASRITELRAAGRLPWVRETGTKARLVDSVASRLAPSLDDWEAIESPLDQRLLEAVLNWAYRHPDFENVLREAYREREPPPVRALYRLVHAWIEGHTFSDIAEDLDFDIDTLLRIHGSVVAHALVTLVEQGIALLERYLADADRSLADVVVSFPDYLRFGVATPAARAMMASGMRHRRAAVALGDEPAMTAPPNVLVHPYDVARVLLQDEERWRAALGEFVFTRTLRDVSGDGSS